MAATLTRPRGATIAALAVALTGSALGLITLALAIVDRDSSPWQPLPGLSIPWTFALQLAEQTIGIVALAIVAGLVVRRQPRSAFAWSFIAVALFFAFFALTGQYAIHGLLVAPGTLPLADAAARYQIVGLAPILIAAIAAALTFPDGRLVSRLSPIVLGASILLAVLDLIVRMDQPYPIWIGLNSLQRVPVTAPPEWWPIGMAFEWTRRGTFWGWIVVAPLIAVSVGLRYRAAAGTTRLQLKWFSYATLIGVAGALATRVNGIDPIADLDREVADGIALWGQEVQNIAITTLLPIVVAVAILRYRLYDIDLVISRTIRYAGIVAFIALTYAVVVASIGAFLGAGLGPVATVVAIAIVALLLDPVRRRLDALANVIVYGRRASPYEILSALASTIAGAERSEVLLQRMADIVREGTHAEGVEVWARVGDVLQRAASSPATDTTRDTYARVADIAARERGAVVEPVYLEGEELGALVVHAPRGETLSHTERRLLRDLASAAGLVFSRFRLVEELRESRARLVAAQDEERRRIERDLHDGAQQRFVNAMLAVGMAQVAETPPSQAHGLLAQATGEMQAGLADLRSLARGLRPPLLAEEGLPAAIAALADRSPILTTLSIETTRRYPAPVETTAYFVVAEALTNAAKHSHASHIGVRVSEVGGELRIEVRDDGIGGVAPERGSGLTGLRDRAAAIGGSVSARSDGGTVVEAEIPCA